jgi:hypothetical protein
MEALPRASSSHLREALEPPALALAAAPWLARTLEPTLLARVKAQGLLTDLQLRSAVQALQALASPPHSFFLGHGPGVGKTRILAAVARHLQLTREGGLVLWLTPNATLCKQALKEAELFGLAPDALFRVESYAQIKEAKLQPAAGQLLVLDEAHVLRGSMRTDGALERLQRVFEAVLYSTATAASQAGHLGYMQRLGIWGPGTSFPGFSDFCQAVRRWGPSASEMLAVDLKQRGLYVCSRLPSAELRELEVAPPPGLEALFDEMCLRWRGARHCSSLDLRSFMKRFVTAVKCRCMLPRWRQDLLDDCAVVVVLQGTGGSSREEAGSSLLRAMCRRNGVPAGEEDLPLDALDEIQRGLAPLPVAELTGRPVSRRQARGGQEASGNAVELARFLRGERRVLCLSAAGALGLNLTSPYRIRVYLLEVPWTPETLAQQLGRCNRVTSRTPPECFSVTMKTFVEKRVEAVLSGRAQTLSALSCADRTSESFSMLTWGKKLLRLVCIELAARGLAERLSEEDLKQLLGAVQERPSLAQGQRYSLLPHLELTEELAAETSPGQHRRLLELLLKSNPFLWDMLWPSWRSSERGGLGQEQRRRAFVSLLCLQRRRLPAALAGCILEYALPDLWCVQDLFGSLPYGHQLLRADLPSFFNAAALLPLRHQRRLYRACEDCHELLGERPAAIKTVLEHCCGRKAPPPGFSCTVRTEHCSEAERRIDVRFLDELAPCEAPRLFLTSSGHVVHVEEAGAEWQYPGKPPLAKRTHQGSVLGPTLLDHVSRSSLRRFRELEAKNLRQRSSVARHLCRTLTLRVQTPLAHWDRSLGTVLAVPESEQHGPFVGLLMASSSRPGCGAQEREL